MSCLSSKQATALRLNTSTDKLRFRVTSASGVIRNDIFSLCQPQICSFEVLKLISGVSWCVGNFVKVGAFQWLALLLILRGQTSSSELGNTCKFWELYLIYYGLEITSTLGVCVKAFSSTGFLLIEKEDRRVGRQREKIKWREIQSFRRFDGVSYFIMTFMP